MPKKSKKSQAARIRWQRSGEMHCATATEQEGVGFQSSGEFMTSAVSHVPSANQGDQHHTLSSPHISYADIVKMTLNSNDPGVMASSNTKQVKRSGDVPSPQVSCANMVRTKLQGNELSVAATSNTNQANHSGDVPLPQVSYADMVKRGLHSNQLSEKVCTYAESYSGDVHQMSDSDILEPDLSTAVLQYSEPGQADTVSLIHAPEQPKVCLYLWVRSWLVKLSC